ncbi:MAG: UxaA family hydrolase [Rhodobiaceae bacterium]|jgi:altronate dehydratase large subunit
MSMSITVSSTDLFDFASSLEWHGYRRSDGRVGIRNHRIVLSTVALTDRLAAAIAATDADSLCVMGAFSRGLQKIDEVMVERFIRSVLTHPNVGAALVLTHDRATAERLAKEIDAAIPIEYLAFMQCAGRAHAVAEGGEKLQMLASRQNKLEQRRTMVGQDAVALALECGGSDVSSSICSNPVIGDICDLTIAVGGSAVVSETAEFIGAEAVFEDRCPDPATRQAVLDFIAYRARLMEQDSGKDYRGTNPTRENIDGGLTTLIEKSMGAVSKTGTTDFVSALEFGMPADAPGLHFMDTPFFSPVSLTGMMMAGCNLGLFAMGVFNPSGNPLCPIIKICGNPQTLRHWREDIDVELDGYFTGELDRGGAQQAVLARMNAVFNGAETASEIFGEGQFMLPRLKDAL